MGRRHSLIALVALAGCNAVFGIEGTRGPDSDGDGRSDVDDNCALVPNDQTNADGDALGDACDPCDGPQSGVDRDGDGIDDACDACGDGSNHDEDGDGVGDGCDVCPGVSDDGADADGDGVGDACDAAPGIANVRVFFDGFGPPRADWRTWFLPWQAVGDGYAPIGTGGAGAWNMAGQVSGTGWWFEVAVKTPEMPTERDFLGIVPRGLPGGYHAKSCVLEYYQGKWWPNFEYSTPVTLGAIVRIRFRLEGMFGECVVDGQPVFVDDTELVPENAHVPSIVSALGGAEFLWIDVVAAP